LSAGQVEITCGDAISVTAPQNFIQSIYGSAWLSELQSDDGTIYASSCDESMTIYADSQHHCEITAHIRQMAAQEGLNVI
jgi:hypothetical protein